MNTVNPDPVQSMTHYILVGDHSIIICDTREEAYRYSIKLDVKGRRHVVIGPENTFLLNRNLSVSPAVPSEEEET
jgi:hypothetical protein